MGVGCQWNQGSKGVRVPRASAARLRDKCFLSPADVIFMHFPLFIQEVLFYDIVLYGSRATKYVMPVFFHVFKKKRECIVVGIDNFLACIFWSSCPIVRF